VAAVVLYYYHVDGHLNGGDMEFCGREPADVLGCGDCSNNYQNLSRNAVRIASQQGRGLTFCRASIEEGTLLVFSNYQFVHRVLRMVNESTTTEASRDFVALFVLDPAVRPLVPARAHISQAALMARTLRAGMPPSTIDTRRIISNILEYLGAWPGSKQVARERAALLSEQLKPQGKFAHGGRVYATGNGCYTMIGWIQNMLSPSIGTIPAMEESAWNGFICLNISPETVGRGASEILSTDTDNLNAQVSDFRLNCEYDSWTEA